MSTLEANIRHADVRRKGWLIRLSIEMKFSSERRIKFHHIVQFKSGKKVPEYMASY